MDENIFCPWLDKIIKDIFGKEEGLMGGNIFCVIILAVLVFTLSGILYYKIFMPNDETDMEHSESVPNQDIAVNETKSSRDIIEISVDSVKGITEQEAEKLCHSVFW